MEQVTIKSATNTSRPSVWGKIPPSLKDAHVSSHSPKISSANINRMTPKHSDTSTITEAIKKRKWSIGQCVTTTVSVTPNPNNTSPIPNSAVICISQKKKKNRKLSQDGETDSLNLVDIQQPEEFFPKLDISDPDSARRVQQRRRTIAMGKNTVGYDEYRKQVPIQQRKPRSMDHPATPDHTLDIPNRRWLGLVRAWRVALHQFDPPEMKDAHANKMLIDQSSTTSSNHSPMQIDSPMMIEPSGEKTKILSVQEEEIEHAKNQGLPVEFNCVSFQTNKSTVAIISQETSSQESKKYPRRVLFTADDDDDDEEEEEDRGKKGAIHYWPYTPKKDDDELDRWEKQTPRQQQEDLLVDYGESDDDDDNLL